MLKDNKKIHDVIKLYHENIKNYNLLKIKEILDEYPEIIDEDISVVAPILYAAQNENWELFEELFVREANLDVKVGGLDMYLIHCVIKNKRTPVQALKGVINYANNNVVNSFGQTPFMVAIESDNKLALELLEKNGKIDLIKKDIKNNNVFHYLANSENYKLFQEILSKNENYYKLIEQKNKNKETPYDLIKDEIFKKGLPNISYIKPTEVIEIKTEEIKDKEPPKNKILSNIKKSI